MSDKIKLHHLERKAILYIRQSSLYQVNHNLESQKLQYAMEERLQQLGWREIEVVDDDLGRSAAGTVTRAGFERMAPALIAHTLPPVEEVAIGLHHRTCRGIEGLVESIVELHRRIRVVGSRKPRSGAGNADGRFKDQLR